MSDATWSDSRGLPSPLTALVCQAGRGGDGLRSSEQPSGEADVVVLEDDRDIHGQQAQHADDDGEQRLGAPVGGDAAHELRPDAVTDREQ
jgi:hypothetical protein